MLDLLRRSTLLSAVISLVLLASEAQAQSTTVRSRPTATATRTDTPPRIDGRLDDAAWQKATRLTEFTQNRPLEGMPASERTEVYLVYNSEALFVGIHAYYADRTLIRANRVDRDKTGDDDTVTVSFDPFLDQQRGYAFSVNGYGIQTDSLVGSGGGTGDTAWNALYQSAAVLGEDGWTAEMAIPVKSLRYPTRPADTPHRWGMQVQREIKGKNETVHWAPVSNSVMGALVQMGTLEGMRNLSTARNLELLPTFTAVEVGRRDANGRFAGDDVEEAGLNIKYGLSSNLTMDFALNPDFSQIESDRPQIEINQRFPVFFPELRPFFVEGADIFNVPTGQPIRMLHTRTILDPQYGLKLTGKVGTNSIAMMVANDEAPGKVDDPALPAYGQSAKILVGRVRHDLYRDSFVGGVFMDREFLDGHSRVVGADLQLRLGRNYQVPIKVFRSQHRDLAGVERTGHMLDAVIRKAGRNFSFLVAENDVTPGFRNDLGFVTRFYRRTIAYTTYKWWPENWIVNWGPTIRFDHAEDYDTGELQEQARFVAIDALLARNITLNTTIYANRERFRGVDFGKQRFTASAQINSSRRWAISADMAHGDEIRYITDPFLGSSTSLNTTVTLRPSSRLQSDISVSSTRFMDVRTDSRVFDVKIFYARTTYQFTNRLVFRNQVEHNTLNGTIGLNLLGTYRVNAGTVFFVGYDDRFRQGDLLDPRLFQTSDYQRTNRAIFTKLQYLYRR